MGYNRASETMSNGQMILESLNNICYSQKLNVRIILYGMVIVGMIDGHMIVGKILIVIKTCAALRRIKSLLQINLLL